MQPLIRLYIMRIYISIDLLLIIGKADTVGCPHTQK